jgi:hypothetical protein
MGKSIDVKRSCHALNFSYNAFAYFRSRFVLFHFVRDYSRFPRYYPTLHTHLQRFFVRTVLVELSSVCLSAFAASEKENVIISQGGRYVQTGPFWRASIGAATF